MRGYKWKTTAVLFAAIIATAAAQPATAETRSPTPWPAAAPPAAPRAAHPPPLAVRGHQPVERRHRNRRHLRLAGLRRRRAGRGRRLACALDPRRAVQLPRVLDVRQRPAEDDLPGLASRAARSQRDE